MNREETIRRFIFGWDHFIAAIRLACDLKLRIYWTRERLNQDRSPEQLKQIEDSIESILSLVVQVTLELRDREPGTLETLLYDEEDLGEELVMLDRLVTEMAFVGTLAERASWSYESASANAWGNESAVTRAAEESNAATDAAKTVKESIEKFLKRFRIKIPKWLSGSLEVLNEILSIVRGV